MKYDIDLKWSLWSSNQTDFAERGYSEALNAMKAAFSGDGEEVTIRTAPRKEIRFGTVGIYEGGAHVEFSFEWDEPYEQASGVEDPPTFLLAEDELRQVTESISEWCSEIEWCVDAEIAATTFEDLMMKIDGVEDRLLDQEQSYSDGFEAFIQTLRKDLQAKRDHRTSELADEKALD